MKKILIAEDNDSNYLLTSIILKKQYEVCRAHNGTEAVALVQEWQPDIVLMDWKMPIMTGLEATMRIREFNATIPIIALTAYAFTSDRQQALEAGCNEFLTKPINVKELINVLSNF